MEFRYERVPRLTLAVGIVGTPIAWITTGLTGALTFVLGAVGSWWNYSHLVATVTALTRAAASGQTLSPGRLVAGLFVRLLLLGAGAIVILKYSKITPWPLLAGFLASFIAICIEILYELLWKSTKSG